MYSKYIAQYKYFLSMVPQNAPNRNESVDVNTVSDTTCVPTFKLDWEIPGTALDPCTRSIMMRLENYYYLAREVCRYLPIFNLIMIYVELGDSAPTWKACVEWEMENRITTLHWQSGYCAGYCLNSFNHEQHTINVSPSLFGTQINSSITLFDTSFSKKVQYNIPMLNYKKTTHFYNYLMNDATFGINMPTIGLGMRRVHFYEPPRNKYTFTIYATLFFPKIPDIDVKYHTSSTDLCSELKPYEEVQCLLFFTTLVEADKEVDILLEDLSKTQTLDIPIVGAYQIQKLLKSQNLTGPECSAYIAFTRRKNSVQNFTAASIVFHENEDDFEKRLVDFKESLVRHSEEFCLNIVHFDKENKHREWVLILHHLDLVVVQCDVNGSIGSTCYKIQQSQDDENPAKRTRTTNTLTHTYASVLLYVGWGSTKSESS